MALTTLSTIKSILNVTTTAQDAWLSALRTAAEAVIARRCNRVFESATYTEYYTGNSTKYLVLRQKPVTSITSVYMDNDGNYGFTSGSFDSTTLLTSGVDYSLDLDTNGTTSSSGILVRMKTVWPMLDRSYTPRQLVLNIGPSMGNIKVTYVAGYTTIPDDLQYAVALIVSIMRRTTPYGVPVTAERIGAYSYELANPYLSRHTPIQPEIASIEQILSKYRDMPL